MTFSAFIAVVSALPWCTILPFFSSSLPNFNYRPLPHEPTNWKFKRLKFCTLYWCLQSFSPAYTDQWSPQPINSPKGWRGRKKVCTQQQQRLKAWVNNKPLKGPGTGLANPNIHSDLSICKVAYCKDNENHFVIIADSLVQLI